jgi:nucleotide-binding universal stress UspA family protein
VDFSAASRRALDLAWELARRLDARVEVLHVWEPPVVLAADLAVSGRDDLARTLQEQAMHEAARELEAFMSHLPASPRASGRLEGGGRAAQAILQAAADGGFDLIVMGTHGRTGLARLLMGSVAERVVRESRCPVLTVSEKVAAGTRASLADPA